MLVEADPAHRSPHKNLRSKVVAATTSQDELFPLRSMRDRLFRIEDDFLYSCITYGEGLEKKPFHGFTWTKGIGYAFLTFFAQKAFGVYRFPFFPDRVFERHPSEENQKVIIEAVQSLTPERIDAICDELVRIYNYTQSLLRDENLSEVHLKRMIVDLRDRPVSRDTYAQTVMRLKKAAKATGQSTVQFEIDILNSWGDDGGYPHYPVMIRQTIPAADVLYFSNMIANRDNSIHTHRAAVEPGEWVVLNRSPTGVIEIEADDILFDEDIYEEVPGWTKRTYEQFLELHSPFPFRKAARVGERYMHESGGWRLTAKGKMHDFVERIFR